MDRPARVTHEPVVVHSKRPVKGILDKLSAKHIASFGDNPHLKGCCADVMSHEVQFEKSNPDLAGPDRAVFTCQCGCRHIRFMSGGSHTSA